MDHCADVGVGKEIDNAILTCFEVDFDFSKRGDIGMGDPVARVIILGHSEQALPGKRCR